MLHQVGVSFAFVSVTLVSIRVLIFSLWVQLSDSTSARGRSEDLLLQLFVSTDTHTNVGSCPEDKSVVLVSVFLN